MANNYVYIHDKIEQVIFSLEANLCLRDTSYKIQSTLIDSGVVLKFYEAETCVGVLMITFQTLQDNSEIRLVKNILFYVKDYILSNRRFAGSVVNLYGSLRVLIKLIDNKIFNEQQIINTYSNGSLLNELLNNNTDTLW